jgi:hypothetical protein
MGGAHHPQHASAQLRSLEQEQQHQHENREHGDQEGHGSFSEGEGRLRQVLGETRQLRSEVLLHPVLYVVLASQVTDPTLAVLGLPHVVGKALGEMGDAVNERVPECRRQAGEYQHRQHGDDRHSSPAPLDHPALEKDDRRVEQ